MSDPEILAVSGLQLSNNTFSASPKGALSKAQNGVISQTGVFQLRNGQERAAELPFADYLPFQQTEFQGAMLAQFGTSKTDTAQGLGYVAAGAVTPYSGTFNPVGDDGSAEDYMRMKFTLASLFLHFACATGPKVLETYNGTPRNAGLSRVPDFGGVLGPATSAQPGVVPYDSSVAYRYVHVRRTSTGQVLVSPPSNRFVMTNRWTVPIGGMVRTGGNLVTATFGEQYLGLALPLSAPGFPFTLTPGEATFAAGSYVTGPSVVTNTARWASIAANGPNTVEQELDTGPLPSLLTIRLPADAIAGDTIQLFKSVASSSSEIEPSDDVYQCNEVTLVAGDIVSGFITITDYTPESVLRVPLYTNPSDGDGQGERGANFPPPVYLDSANFGSTTFYLGTTNQQYLDLAMLGVGGPDGVQDGDTITIFDGVSTTNVYRFKTTPALANDVQLVSDGTPSVNIAWTTYFLIATASVDLVPLGLSITGETSPTGAPGGFRIERTDYLQTQFQVKASRPESWTPGLQTAVYTDSFGDVRPNGLQWGKLGQPEAVPPLNANTIGVSNYYGRRCFGLKNALIILKEGDGVWSLTGSPGSFNLQQISKANTIAPDCAGVFADQVWAYTDQGLLRISDSGGVTVVSRPIETELNALAAALPNETYAWSFAVPYETERRIMFFVPFEEATPANGDAPLMKAWCYSAATNAWTGPLVFNGNPLSGIVSTAKKLWVGLYDSTFSVGRLTSERKTGSYLDIADDEWDNTLTTTANPLRVELTLYGNIRRGTGISQVVGGLTYRTKVAEVIGGGVYELAEEFPWVNGACVIYDPFAVNAQFLPAGTPGARKVLTRLVTLYKPLSFANYFGVTTLETDQIQEELEIETPGLGYGLTPYGQGSYGNPTPMVVDTNPIDKQWTNAGQFFPGMKFDEVWILFKLQGVGMQVESASAPVGRGR